MRPETRSLSDRDIDIKSLAGIPDAGREEPGTDGVRRGTSEEKRVTPKEFRDGRMISPTHLPYSASAGKGFDVWDGVRMADASHKNPDCIVLLYSRYEIRPGSRGSEYSEGRWTREHVWPQSRGGRPVGPEGAAHDGRMSTLTPGMGTDLHNIFAADKSVNSARQNKHLAIVPEGTPVFDRTPMGGSDGRLTAKTSADAWEPPDSAKGVVARAALYMACMYAERVRLVRGFGDGPGEMGDAGDVLDWNARFPPDEREKNRNDVVEDFQGNRNPFIDDPAAAGLVDWDAPRFDEGA